MTTTHTNGDEEAGRPLGEPVRCETLDVADTDIALLTLNRPAQRNPLDAATITLVHHHLSALADQGGPRAVVLTGAGSAFSAGGDLKGYRALYRRPDDLAAFLRTFYEVCELLERGPFVSVAMINGTCVAGGLELALACDLSTIAAGARIGDGHLRFGQLPGSGGSQRLVRAIGAHRARHWLLTGRLFSAEEAFDAGLVADVVPDEMLLARTLDLLATVVVHSPLGIRRMKELIRLAQEAPLSQGLEEEMRIVAEYATTSHDASEGLRAFAARERSNFLGR